MKSNGIYNKLVQIVRAAKAAGEVLLNAKTLRERALRYIRSEKLSRAELENHYARALVALVLNQNKCYALRRGTGIYVNLDACTNIEELKKLLENKGIDIKADTKTYREIIEQMRKSDERTIPGQYAVDFENPDKFIPEKSVEDTLREAFG